MIRLNQQELETLSKKNLHRHGFSAAHAQAVTDTVVAG
jgi:LDH2 family malate/lactate/ureidoglycolate dehydrogenase